ncbi:uncharacterized protein BKA78DRAFT_297551 [Phyllosticta capitalensis]|uniref:uncharacterized protein n=1 Tax=Phyllosticta capitalensis TaxID=121624 RepID=UPI003131BA6F
MHRRPDLVNVLDKLIAGPLVLGTAGPLVLGKHRFEDFMVIKARSLTALEPVSKVSEYPNPAMGKNAGKGEDLAANFLLASGKPEQLDRATHCDQDVCCVPILGISVRPMDRLDNEKGEIQILGDPT